MNAVQEQWEEDNSFSQEKEAWRKEQQYHEFENNMNRYKKENESSILSFARDLYMVVTLFKYPKCNYCGTDKSVKYEDNSKPYCNRCILTIRRKHD